MLYVAIDIHKRSFQAAVFDSESGVVSEQRFDASREQLRDWAMPLHGPYGSQTRSRAQILGFAARSH
jgi:hypothetical protein